MPKRSYERDHYHRIVVEIEKLAKRSARLVGWKRFPQVHGRASREGWKDECERLVTEISQKSQKNGRYNFRPHSILPIGSLQACRVVWRRRVQV